MPAGSNVGITWVVPPDKLAEAIRQYGDRVMTAVAALAGRMATIMENDAKQNAKWEDRTGNARSGLYGTVETDMAKTLVTIYLSHGPSIDYGMILETSHGGRYAIIMPTIQAHLPELKKMLQDLLG